MIHPILAYGDPILKLKASNISIGENNDLGSLIKDLWETMYNANGVGIAAPQIGISKAIFVADFSYFKDEESFREQELINMQQVFINPEIIKETGSNFTFPEGCLSIPNISENVIRKEKIRIKFLDKKLESKEMNCSGIIARVIQHEFDHLQGILFTDKLSYKKRKLLKEELNLISVGKIDVKYQMRFFKE
jgi:peptide deformylase|tara:strand:+ start:209 stop:781 length:573 start_codon:yes stop_codon:yes gene_type:complete